MSRALEFHLVQWLARDHGDPAERASFGELEVRVADRVVTRLLDHETRSERTAIRVSMGVLARWLASNYFRLRFEPSPLEPSNDPEFRCRHEVGAAGDGFLWPSLSFSGDLERVVVEHRASEPGSTIRFLEEDFRATVSVEDFDWAVDSFLDLVIERLHVLGCADDDLTNLWTTVASERRDPDTFHQRRLEALMGLDPEELPASAVSDLVASGRWMGLSALEEVLADAKHTRGQARIEALREARRRPDGYLNLTSLRGVVAGSTRDEPPWKRGMRLARDLRQSLNLGEGPISNDTFRDLFGLDLPRATPDGSDISAGFVDGGDPTTIGVVLHKGHPSSLRFASARILGDALTRPETDSLLPVTDQATARQKTQRAFAQEFLCPIEAIRQRVSLPVPTEEEVLQVASDYQVSEWLVRTALVNRGLVDRGFLPNALEAQV